MSFAVGALVTLLVALAVPAHAAERLVPAKRLLPWFDYYLGMPEARRDRFRPAYQVLVDGKPYLGAVALIDEGRRIPLALGPDGRFDQFPTLAQLKRRPMLALDAPAHARIKADLGVEALTPHGEDEPVEPFWSPTRQPAAVLVRVPTPPARVMLVPGA